MAVAWTIELVFDSLEKCHVDVTRFRYFCDERIFLGIFRTGEK